MIKALRSEINYLVSKQVSKVMSDISALQT